MEQTQFMPLTGNQTLDHVLTLLGIFVTLSSAAATFLNSKIRAALDEGEDIPTPFAWLGFIVNCLAFNVDKAAQMQRVLKGGKVTITKVHVDRTPEKSS